MSDERSKVMDKVQKLLAKAESSPFSEEAQTFRQKAEELMTIYAIESFDLQQRDPSRRTEPILSDFVEVSGANSTIRQSLIDLFGTVSRHCRVRCVFYGADEPRYSCRAKMVGYPEDIEYATMLFTSLRMTLARDISPTWDPAMTLGENVRKMKEAGMKWEEIARRCDPDWDGVMTPKWVGIYKKECDRVGVVPVKANPKNYVKNFAAGFVGEVSMRLADMRRHAEAQVDTSTALVVFKDKAQHVNEKVDEFFGNSLKPIRYRDNGKMDMRARGAGAESGRKADLSGGRNQTTTAERGRALGK